MAKGAPKGNCYNPKGRGKSKNVKTLEWEAFGKRLLEVGLPRMARLIESGEYPEEDFVRTFIALLEYFKPKLARQELTDKDGERLFPSPILDVIPKDNSDKKDNGTNQKD